MFSYATPLQSIAQKTMLSPIMPAPTCLHMPFLGILTHSQVLIFKIVSELSSCSKPMFPTSLTNLSTLLVTKLQTGPDQGYSRPKDRMTGYASEHAKLPHKVKGQTFATWRVSCLSLTYR